VIITVQLFVF